MAGRRPSAYRWSETVLLRASTDPGGLDLPRSLDFAWLSAMWRREDVRAGIGVASAELVRQIDVVVAGRQHDGRATQRAMLAFASYLLRWKGRATPFGAFAGIGAAAVGETTRVRWGCDHRQSVRADEAWLGHVLAQLHRCEHLVERLSVMANTTYIVRGDRVVAPGAAPNNRHELAPIEVSIRHGAAASAVLEAAREPVIFSQLRDALTHRFPTATKSGITHFLTGLLDLGILVSDLQAPMTCLDALGHMCEVLDAAGAGGIPGIDGLTRDLADIHAMQRAIPATPHALVSLAPIAARMRAISDATEVPLLVDTVADCDVEIPRQVAQEARDAVEVLLRLSPDPLGGPSWRDYHDRFRLRYGIGAQVPVLDLVADSGLGYPPGYLGAGQGGTTRGLAERDEKIQALIQQATVDGSGEIVLTDQLIDDLTVRELETTHLPPRLEIAVEIRAASASNLTGGRFTLMVTGTPRPGSSMTGRHAYLLPDEHQHALAKTYAATGTDVIAAQLSFPPRRQRNGNVARTVQLLPDVISLGEHREPGDCVIAVADLAVTVDDRRFYLTHLPTGRRVEPRVTHALEAASQTPPLARFLSEVTTARRSVYRGFNFGAASALPYLPRVRRGRTILSPARWLLRPAELPDPDAPRCQWDEALASWRHRWRVPRHVAMVDVDRRVPVDLYHPTHRLVLRARLQRTRRPLELREAAAPADHAWLGRAHEVVIPLVQKAPEQPAILHRYPARHDAGHLPGNSAILYAQIHAHPQRVSSLVTEHLPHLIAAFDDDAPTWWFRRHREQRHPDRGQYLALYLLLPAPTAYGQAAEHLAIWAEQLRSTRLVSALTLATYDPQVGRYGYGTAMDAAHHAFAADSAAAVAQLTTAADARANPQALAAASMIDMATRFAPASQAGMKWLVQELPRERGRLDRELRDQALALADPSGKWAALRRLPGGTELLTTWEARAEALATYRTRLAEQRDPLTALSPLLHSHHNRAVSVDSVMEKITGRLVRACALRYIETARQ